MKRVALIGLVLAGYANRHPILVGIPVVVTCMAGVGAASAAGQAGGSGDPGEFCAKLAEAASEPSKTRRPPPGAMRCIPIGERWDCRTLDRR
jgi:hypothetical protein